jgi:hypothetical protein
MFSVKKLLAVILSISASLALCGCENAAVSVSETLSETVSVTETIETTMPKVIPEEYIEMTEMPDVDGEFVIEKGSEYRISGVVTVSKDETLQINGGGELVIVGGGELIVEDGGKFIIGVPKETSYSKITITEGGMLTVRNGGMVTIDSDRIRFKVDENGTIKLSDANIKNSEDGAGQITFLEGSVLDISGDVSLPIEQKGGLLISERGEFRTNSGVNSFETESDVVKSAVNMKTFDYKYVLQNKNEFIIYQNGNLSPGGNVYVADRDVKSLWINESHVIEESEYMWIYKDIAEILESADSFSISYSQKGGEAEFDNEYFINIVGRDAFSFSPFGWGTSFSEIYGPLDLTAVGQQYFEMTGRTVFGENAQVNITSLPDESSNEEGRILWIISYSDDESARITVHKNAMGITEIQGFVDFLNTLEIGSTPTALSVDFVTDDVPVTHTIYYDGNEFSLTDNRGPDIGEIYVHPDIPVYVTVQYDDGYIDDTYGLRNY